MKWEKIFEYVISIVLLIVWITITGMLIFSSLLSTKIIGLVFLLLGILLIYKTITDKKT